MDWWIGLRYRRSPGPESWMRLRSVIASRVKSSSRLPLAKDRLLNSCVSPSVLNARSAIFATRNRSRDCSPSTTHTGPRCQGFGNTIDFDLDLVIPDKSLTLNQGAIEPWTSRNTARCLRTSSASPRNRHPHGCALERTGSRASGIRSLRGEGRFLGVRGFFNHWSERNTSFTSACS